MPPEVSIQAGTCKIHIMLSSKACNNTNAYNSASPLTLEEALLTATQQVEIDEKNGPPPCGQLGAGSSSDAGQHRREQQEEGRQGVALPIACDVVDSSSDLEEHENSQRRIDLQVDSRLIAQLCSGAAAAEEQPNTLIAAGIFFDWCLVEESRLVCSSRRCGPRRSEYWGCRFILF